MTAEELMALLRQHVLGQGVPTGMRMAPQASAMPSILPEVGPPMGLRMAPALGTAEGGMRLPVMSDELRRWYEENHRGLEAGRPRGVLSRPNVPVPVGALGAAHG